MNKHINSKPDLLEHKRKYEYRYSSLLQASGVRITILGTISFLVMFWYAKPSNKSFYHPIMVLKTVVNMALVMSYHLYNKYHVAILWVAMGK